MALKQSGALTEIGPPSDEVCRDVWTKWGEAHAITHLDPRFETVYGLLRNEVERLPVGDLVVDSGAGESVLEPMFGHGHYLSIDFVDGGAVMGWNFTNLDILGDVNSLPVASNSAALALSITVLEHSDAPNQTIAEIFRVLRPGGRAFFYAPFLCPPHQEPHDYFRYTGHGLMTVLSGAGFDNMAVYADCSERFANAYSGGHAILEATRNISGDAETMRRLEEAHQTVEAVVSAAFHLDPKVASQFARNSPQLALGYVGICEKPGGPLTPLDLASRDKSDVIRQFARCPDCPDDALDWADDAATCTGCGNAYDVRDGALDTLNPTGPTRGSSTESAYNGN